MAANLRLLLRSSGCSLCSVHRSRRPRLPALQTAQTFQTAAAAEATGRSQAHRGATRSIMLHGTSHGPQQDKTAMKEPVNSANQSDYGHKTSRCAIINCTT